MRRLRKRPVSDGALSGPIWLDGPVPSGFWHDPRNRRQFILWLGQKLRFKKLDDWYRVTARDFQRNHGGGLFANYWRCSPVEALKECYPDHEWYEWLFGQAPNNFWQDGHNHRRYMDWLAGQLGINCPGRFGTMCPAKTSRRTRAVPCC